MSDTNKKLQFNKKSKVVNSPHFALIMDNYDKFGKSMANKEFWSRYVITLDPSIVYMTWMRFIKTITQEIDKKTLFVIDKFIDKKADENRMEKTSIQKILAISDITLDALVDDPNLLACIPIKERMSWLFQAMKARDNRMVTLTKVQAEKRKTTMYEDMMQAAQYGEIEEGEFDEDQSEEEIEPVKSMQTAPKPMQTSDKVIQFDPNNI